MVKIQNVAGPASEFLKNITENVSPKTTIILGVSGGADSLYLFHHCLQLQKKMNLKLVVAHVNHGLRGKESDRDEKFVEQLCNKTGTTYEHIKLNLKPETPNLEEISRDARYTYFEQLREKYHAQWILTAHHLNDNIETMLLNLIRGAHLNGLKGMAVASKKTHLLRPLLGITKQEILQYLQENRLPFQQDSSNENTDFSRNWIRKNIIPGFSKINPNFEKTFKDTLHNLTQTSQYLEQSCADWLKKNAEEFQKEFHIELDTFLQEHLAFQKQLLTHLYTSHHSSTKKLTNKHLNEILETLHLRQANKKKEFGPQTFIEIFSKTVNTGKSRIKKPRRYIRLINKK